MTEQEYNAAEGIRRSDLWWMSKSPEKFKWHIDHPEYESEKSPALMFGSAAHKWVLEPQDWEKEYCIAPAVDRRTKAGKEEWEQFVAEHSGKVVVKAEDFDKIIDMTVAAMSCPLASDMLTKGQKEVPFFWTDPETGERCKAKADVVRMVDGKYVIVDYKTTTDASTEVFSQHIVKLGYHVQAAMYTEGLQIALGLDYRPKFYFVPQEKTEPYAVNVVEVGEDVIRYGDSVYHELMRKYHECKMMDIWGGYCDDVANEAVLPGWIGLGEDEEV